jgi:leukotriene-A4 hydrolase
LTSFYSNDKEATDALAKVSWDTWFYSPGYPPKPDYDDSMVRVCYALADRWKARAIKDFTPSSDDIKGWAGNQSVVFLDTLQSGVPLRPEDVVTLGNTYGYAASDNVELVSRFFGVGLKAREQSVYQPTADLLGKVGRMKFVRPLYRDLSICDRDLAVKTFEKNKNFYHPICRAMVEKDLFGKK